MNRQSIIDLEDSSCLKHYELRGAWQLHNGAAMVEAWDTQLLRKVAIERYDFTTQEVNREALHKQARDIAALRNPLFTKVHAVEEQHDCLYVVLEWIDGENLKSKINTSPFDSQQVLTLLLQLSEALAEAHACGLCYGDLKPQRIYCDASGRIRLANFGFQSKLDQQSIALIGQEEFEESMPYLAPERFNQHQATTQSDIFSLGSIVYEMLTGQLPFSKLTGLALVSAQVQTNPAQWYWPDKTPHSLKLLVNAMCAVSIEHRMTMNEVVDKSRELLLSTSKVVTENFERRSMWWSKFSLKNTLFVGVLGCLLAFSIWKSPQYWPQLVEKLTPYSESWEMQVGAEALLQYNYKQSSADLEKANQHFSKVLSQSPDNAEAIAYMSLVYLGMYNAQKRDEIWLQKAKASAQEAMKLNPNSAMSLIAYAKILHWHHKLSEALALSEKAISIQPGNLYGWHTKMSALLESNKYDEVLKFGEKGSQLFPKDRFLLELMSAVYLNKSNYIEAEKLLRKSIQRQPDSPNSYALLGYALQGQGHIKEALEMMQRGLQIRPNAMLYGQLAEIKFYLGEYDAAAAAYKSAVSPEKGITGSYYRWLLYAEALMWVDGKNLEGLQAYRNAKKLLEVRLKRSPDDEVLLSHMALILARLGDKAAALKSANRAISIGQNTSDVFFYSGLTYELLGERALAVQCIKKTNQFGLLKAEVKGHPILRSMMRDTNNLQ